VCGEVKVKTYLIGYDLNKPRDNNDYADLIAKIKVIAPAWWHCLDSTWIIKSDSDTVAIRNALKPYLDSGDELLVVRLEGTGAWAGFDDDCSSWLSNNLSYV
jgi:hypothetical protein